LQFYYGITYDVISEGNVLALNKRKLVVAGVSVDWDETAVGLVPITWNAGIPYITYEWHAHYTGMAAGSNTWQAGVTIYLLGVTV
jgi:hypothetical protein